MFFDGLKYLLLCPELVKIIIMKLNLKALTLVIIAVVSISFVNAQQVDFNDLMNNKSGSEVNTSKKWIKDFNEAKDNSIAKEVLSLELQKMTKSKHWYSMVEEGQASKELSFQTTKKMHVDKVVENLKEAGFELMNTKCTTDCKTFIYTKNSFTIEVISMEAETTAQTIYLVTLL